jgi:hypothetical protein
VGEEDGCIGFELLMAEVMAADALAVVALVLAVSEAPSHL